MQSVGADECSQFISDAMLQFRLWALSLSLCVQVEAGIEMIKKQIQIMSPDKHFRLPVY